MHERVYQVPIQDADDWQQRLIETWTEFQQTAVDYAIDWRRKTLEQCVMCTPKMMTLNSFCDVVKCRISLVHLIKVTSFTAKSGVALKRSGCCVV